MPIKLTVEQYQNRLDTKFGKNSIICTSYDGLYTKGLFKCVKCKDTWSCLPNDMSKRKGCPRCCGTKPMGLAGKISKLKLRLPHVTLYKQLDGDRDLFRCSVHDKIWESTFFNLLHSTNGCPECGKEAKRFKVTRESDRLYKDKLKSIHGDSVVLGRTAHYGGERLDIEHRCTVCETTWEAKPNYVTGTRTSGCPSCANRKRQSATRSYKIATVRGRDIPMMGFEPQALEHLLSSGLKLSNLRFALVGGVPIINYISRYSPSVKRKYTADFFIRSLNTLVEVKSTYSLGLHARGLYSKKTFYDIQTRAVESVNSGYKFQLLVLLANGGVKKVPKNWMHLSFSKFKACFNKLNK